MSAMWKRLVSLKTCYLTLSIFLATAAEATILPVSPEERIHLCRPGSPWLQSDVCFGEVYSQRPEHLPSVRYPNRRYERTEENIDEYVVCCEEEIQVIPVQPRRSFEFNIGAFWNERRRHHHHPHYYPYTPNPIGYGYPVYPTFTSPWVVEQPHSGFQFDLGFWKQGH